MIVTIITTTITATTTTATATTITTVTAKQAKVVITAHEDRHGFSVGPFLITLVKWIPICRGTFLGLTTQ